MTLIVEAAAFVESATEVAVSVMVAFAESCAGAVYVTATPEALVVDDSDPQPLPLQPESAQATPLFCGSLATEAVKAWVPPACSETPCGETEMETASCGVGLVVGGGGSTCGCRELVPLEGTDAHPPRTNVSKSKDTTTATGAVAACTPRSEIKVECLRRLTRVGRVQFLPK